MSQTIIRLSSYSPLQDSVRKKESKKGEEIRGKEKEIKR